jgi:L-malate glycosyltransferase
MIPRLCVVSALYHPDLGGLGRQAQLLSERLRKGGVELFVIARKMEVNDRASFSASVEVVRVPSLFPKHHILEEISLKNILVSVIFSLGCLVVLIRRRRSYNLVHFHGASIPLFVTLPCLKWMGKKVVAKVAAANLGTEAGSLSGRYWVVGDLLSGLMKKVDIFIAISEEIKTGLLQDGVPRERIRRIANFIDPSRFHPPEPGEKEVRKADLGYAGKLLVLFAGRLVPRKGVEFLLKAWQNLSSGFPDARLLLLGDGPLLSPLEKMASAFGISESARFLGRVDNVDEYLRAADIFVLPSLQEGLSNSLLEAMASGTAVLATRIGGVTDVVEDNVDAILVGPGDAVDMAEGLRVLLGDESVRGRCSSSAAEKMNRLYSLESRVEKYVALYVDTFGGASK